MSETSPLYAQTRDHSGKIRRILIDDRGVRVGSAEDCDLSLEGLARNHARIERKDDVVRITDLGGRGGTHVQGRLLTPFVQTDWLEHQAIQIGAYRFALVRELVGVKQNGSLSAVETAAPPPPNQKQFEVSLTPENLVIEPGREAEAVVQIFNRTGKRQKCRIIISSMGDLGAILAQNELERELIIDDTTSGAGAAALVPFRFLVKKEPQSTVGQFPVTVTVANISQPELSVKVQTTWSVEPYYDRPDHMQVLGFGRQFRRSSSNAERRRGAREVTFRLSLYNPTNATIFYRLKAHYDPNVLTHTLNPDLLVVEPGGTREFELTVRANDTVDEDTRHELSVGAQPTGLSATDVIESPQLEFVQVRARPQFVILWPLLLAGIALLGLIVIILALSKQHPESQQASPTPNIDITQQIATIADEVIAQRNATYLNLYATVAMSATIQAQGTTAAISIAQAAQATQAQQFDIAFQTATALVNANAKRELADQVAQTVGLQVTAVYQQVDATRQAEVAALNQTVTAVAGQTATSEAGKTIVAESQQQQTAVAGQKIQLELQVANATQQALPAALVISPMPPCVRENATIEPVIVSVRDGNGRIAETTPITITMSLSADDPAFKGNLKGQATLVATQGIARFSGLKISRTGSYRLRAKSGNFVAEAPIKVVARDEPCNPIPSPAGAAPSQSREMAIVPAPAPSTQLAAATTPQPAATTAPAPVPLAVPAQPAATALPAAAPTPVPATPPA